MKIERTLLFFLLVIAVIVTTSLFLSGNPALAGAIILAFVISFVYIGIAFISTSKAFARSSASFYRLFFGGLVIRFIFFIATLFVVYKFTSISILAFAISFILFYVIFQGFEIRYIWKKLDHQKLK